VKRPKVSDTSSSNPYSLEYWAARSGQGGPNQGALMKAHIRRTQVRFWLLVAALLTVVVFSVALEYIRSFADGVTFSPWRCLFGVLPGLLGLAAVLGICTAFVRDVYEFSDWHTALSYVWLLLFGRAPFSLFDLMPSSTPIAPYPSLTVQQGKVDEKHKDTELARLGGPGNVKIFNDSAVFLERFGRFTRVAGPGKVFLQRFERIHEVLDLRPQERSSTATAETKDGIPVEAEVQVRFQLARPPTSLVAPTPDVPHPVYEWALIRAGQCHRRVVNLDNGSEKIPRWADRVGVGGTLRGLVAGYRLDELLEPYEPGRDPRREISEQLLHKGNDSARGVGAQVLDVRLGALEPTLDAVKKERIDSWQAAWKSKARKEEAMGQAEVIRERGLARAYAQMEIILSLAREFQDAVERNVALPAEIIILRFMEALRETWSRPGVASVPSQVFQMWRSLQHDLERLIGPGRLLREGEGETGQPPEGQE
jgi:hypothetical protein